MYFGVLVFENKVIWEESELNENKTKSGQENKKEKKKKILQICLLCTKSYICIVGF